MKAQLSDDQVIDLIVIAKQWKKQIYETPGTFTKTTEYVGYVGKQIKVTVLVESLEISSSIKGISLDPIENTARFVCNKVYISYRGVTIGFLQNYTVLERIIKDISSLCFTIYNEDELIDQGIMTATRALKKREKIAC